VAEFSPGLEGVVAAETAVSEVDGANGRLIYRGGYLIEDLVPVASYEEAAYLLWHGELPNEQELDALRQQMAAARNLNQSARGTLTAMDPATDPMDVLRTVVSAQGAAKSLTKPTLDEAIALTAIFPTIVGAAYRRRQGKEPVEPRADLGHAANLLWMMDGKEPEAAKVHLVDTYLVLLADHGLNASTFAARVVASTGSDLTSCVVGATQRRRQGKDPVEPRDDLGHAGNLLWCLEGKEPDAQKAHWVDSYLVLLADHGLNASTFAARVVASTGSDLASCVVGAIAALKGPAHGGATFAARSMLDKIGSADNAEKWLTEAHARHDRFSGFGHRVYRTYDPRAKILREMAKSAAPELYKTAARTEELALKILHEAHPERPNATNVDFWASVVLTGAGVPKELFTTLFATSRVAGWTAHVLESLSDLRIIRPASRWIGPQPGKKPLQLAKR